MITVFVLIAMIYMCSMMNISGYTKKEVDDI